MDFHFPGNQINKLVTTYKYLELFNLVFLFKIFNNYGQMDGLDEDIRCLTLCLENFTVVITVFSKTVSKLC